MFDNLQGGWDYDIVGELAAVVARQCSHEDTGSQVGSSAAAAAAAVVALAAVAAAAVGAVDAGVAGVAAAEAMG